MSKRKTKVPSPKVATYDLKPEMSAYEVKDKLVEVAGRKVACEGELERAVILESKFLAEARDRRF